MTDTTEIVGGLRKLGPLALLPVLVAAAAAAYTYRNTPDPPTQYLATTVITPPTTVQDSASAVNLFIADLSELIVADATVSQVVDQVPGLEREIYLKNISASRRETTSSVALTFLHADQTVAKTTVGTLARQLLDEAARGEFERTQFLLQRATERLDQAEAEMEQFFGGVSVFDPEFEYRSVLNEITQLDQQITTGQALSYGETYLTELTARRSELQDLLPGLGEAMLTYRRLAAELENARAAWEAATINNDLAEFEYRTVNSVDALIISEEVGPFVDATPRLQRTSLAAAVALVLSLVVVLPFSARLSRPRGRHKADAEATPVRNVDLNALSREDPSNAFDSARDILVEALLMGDPNTSRASGKASSSPPLERASDRRTQKRQR